ncbi:glycosyltransferase family 2 protein [Flavobacterium crassostreae]|uniref:Glycosyl transferase family 2 n=1 Tax=Flavobacterium crassostreae TaxID=1763534 RepID=A0A1B9E3M5_9FLAO|nr:glycosyltransferase family A protein [Flavobacterium crassostreae]OCB76540.1 glycosyl transferase family 2 [Flavobacterium crassostreae]
MKFALIICTYMRPEPLLRLLESVQKQTLYPDRILIIDGSTDVATEAILQQHTFNNLDYFKVTAQDRGLTKQRNYGIARVANGIDVVCFLDDDTVLEEDYLEQIRSTYQQYPDAVGVGGYISNEIKSEFVGYDYQPSRDEYYFDGWKQKEGSRFVMRKKLGLDSDCPPGYSSMYSHGRSVGFLPPSGKVYPVEMLMGGVSSFQKTVFNTQVFSTYFEGYGLYEDADFTLRVSKMGQLYLNTAAKLKHYHDAAGRPNPYHYGKMVVRNGWYVWRTKNPKPTIQHQLKWHAITILLTLIRFTNVLTSSSKKEALTEALGRTVGWWSLLLNKPRRN